MILNRAVAIFITAVFPALIFAQTETYSVGKAYFSTDKYDEFAPVCYKNGVVYCSNKPMNKLLGYSNEDNKGFFKILFADTIPGESQGSRFLSKKLNSKLNDGPVTFSIHRDTVYFSRNLMVDGKIEEVSSSRNKLGIFYAVLDGDDWTKIRELRINNEWYNVTSPSLSPDGKRLYFASDKPGGYGGSDIYYTQWKNDYWDDPVNLGPVINTKGNESYPFINAAGEFFFASDGHPGHGGKDIFFSHYTDSVWSEPICLDEPVNSKFDDFGIYTDTLMEKGYFSSNRNKSVDVFHFTTLFPQIFYTSQQQANSYCFTFTDSGSIAVDTMHLKYRWSFGDGKIAEGPVTAHCYSGPGKYEVVLDIVERESGNIFFTKVMDDLVLHEFRQPFINSPGIALKGEKISFDGLRSYLPGYRKLSYSWDFGDKSRAKGDQTTHTYNSAGEYVINLELALRSDSSGMIKKTGVSRKIKIFDTKAQITEYEGRTASSKKNTPDFRNSANVGVAVRYSAEEDFRSDAVFRVELLNSKTRIDMKGTQFKKIPSVYTVKEKFEPVEGVYSYTVDQQTNLMATYPAYLRMIALGFQDAKVKIVMLTDPAEKELINLVRINGANTDSYFDYSDRLTSTAFIMLDQIVKLLNKYPTLRLEIAVHTDNSGTPEASQTISQKKAQLLLEYLINRGISVRRLVAVGYGSAKPVALNNSEREKKLNRRIEFSILNK